MNDRGDPRPRSAPQDAQPEGQQRMAFWPVLAWHLVLHAGLGAALPEIVWLLCRVTGPGEHQCLIFLLYPVAGGMLSWLFLLGAPAAGLMVALRCYLLPEVEGGPTAKALSEAFRVWIPASVLLPEIVVAVVQWARIQRSLPKKRAYRTRFILRDFCAK